MPRNSRISPGAAAAVLAAAVGVALSFAAAYRWQTRILEAAARGELRSAADLTARRIAEWRQGRIALGQRVAGLAPLAADLDGFLSSGPDPRAERRIRDWLEPLAVADDFTGAEILDAEGTSRLRTGLTYAASPALLLDARRLGRPSLSELSRDPGVAPRLTLVVPLGGAAVVFTIDPERRLFPLMSYPRESRTGETLLARGGADTKAAGGAWGTRDVEDLRHQYGAALKVSGGGSASDVVEGTDYRGAAVVAAAARVPESSWMAVAKVEAEELRAPVRRQALVAGTAAGATALAAVLAVALALRASAAGGPRAGSSRDEKLGLLLRQANDIVLLLDEDLRIVDANNRAVKAYGYSLEELRSMSSQALKAVLDSDVERQREILSSDGLVYESVHRRRDGTTFPVEVSARVVEVDGRRYFQAITRDITQRRKAEESSRLLARAIEHSAESVLITDAEGRIQYVNPAFEKVSGYTRDEALGKNPRLLRSGAHDHAFYAELWRTIAAGRTWTGALVNRRKDGTQYEEEAVISPVTDDGGRIFSYVAVKRDVTRERQVESQLQQAQKMEAVGRLAGGVAHDFNNLLTVINGFCELVLLKLPADSPVRSQVEEIAKAGDRAAALTRQLLAFSRKQVLQPKVLDLNTLVRDLEHLLRRVIPADVEVQLALDPALPPVKADPGQLEQVLMNLAMNARDAMPEGGTLTIATGSVRHPGDSDIAEGDYVRLSVSDTGVGMSPEVKAHLFEPFFTTKEVGKGTGLGLATVYGIVRQSGGTVAVESRASGGSSFHVLLPPAQGPPDVRRISRPRLQIGKERILVVEDDPMVRNLAASILRGGGYTVSAVADGPEAKERLRLDDSDLVLSDVVLPGQAGPDIVEELRDMRPDLRVVFMSGYATDYLAGRRLDPGVTLLQKPFTAGTLLRAVREALETPAPERLRAAPPAPTKGA